MSMPKASIATTVPKRIQSVLSLCISVCLLQFIHDPLERFAPVFEAAELVEAGARRGQQDGVAGPGPAPCLANRRLQGAGIDQRNRSVEGGADLGRGGADEQHRVRLLPQRLPQ